MLSIPIFTSLTAQLSFFFVARRRVGRSRDNLLSSSSQQGVVYFSDVTELRAAAQEMNGFRIVSSLSRNTGFGATQTVSYLKYELLFM